MIICIETENFEEKECNVEDFLSLYRDTYAVIQDITFHCDNRKYHLYFTKKAELAAKIHEMERIGELCAMVFD